MRHVRDSCHIWSPGSNSLSALWWKQAAVGYIAACVMAVVGIGITLLEETLLAHSYFSASFLLLATLLVSHVWGVGPGLLTALLGCVALSAFLALPRNATNPTLLDWELLFRLFPFTIASLIVAIITGQREAARQLLQRRAAELAIANQELEQANHLKDVFLTRAAHELRTPLTTILGETQLALRRLNKAEGTEADCLKSLTKIEARSKHMQTFIEELLELSRLRAHEAPLRLAPCDFGEICWEVIEEQQAFSGRQIVAHLPSRALVLQADRARLSQVLIHLVENALTYSFGDTPIHLEVRADDWCLLLQVTNKGIGLSPEQQALVFEPFYRTSFAQDVFPKGWGLGLTISKEIVERHHGQIWIETIEGKAITFFVRLPFPHELP